MATFDFSNMPSVSISRSKFDRTSRHPTSFNLGDIIPIYVDEVLPGDTRKLDIGSLVRMSTPIAPIMDDIELDLHAFFVPNRLTYDKWKLVMGENINGAGAVNYSSINGVPAYSYNATTLPVGSIGDYMGLPYNSTVSLAKCSLLPLRAYELIYNRWYRNQNLIAPVPVQTSDPQVYPGHIDDYSIMPFKASKKADYFNRAMPYAQKGDPVKIINGLAPVITTGTRLNLGTTIAPMTFKKSDGSNVIPGNTKALGINTSGRLATYDTGASTSDLVVPDNLYANLADAVGGTINDLRLAFQTQKLLEKDALYGTRYWEILYAHFGVSSPDATLQDPEYLGGAKFLININQVLQTTGFSNDASSTLGQPGANSVTSWRGSLFTKSFVEHGFIIVCAVARQKNHTYGQGMNRMFSRFNRFDFYWPVFANLGAQPVYNKELFLVNNDSVFGYQEAWAEYRYKPSHVSGILNPVRSNSLDYWTLAESFATAPTLSKSFVEEDRANLARCLTTGSSGPDFIADFYFKDVAVRPMPTYSIPGLVDHH